MVLDPVIHCVTTDHADVPHLASDARLQYRVDVGEEKVFAIGICRRNLRFELLENVKIRAERLRLIERAGVGSGPVEAEAWRTLNAIRVDAASGKDSLVFGQKI